MSVLTAKELAVERERRARFAHAIYASTILLGRRFANAYAIGESLSFDKATTNRVMEYLEGQGIAAYVVTGGNVALTHAGRLEVEEAISSPDRPTRHFVANNIVNFGTINNPQIVQGSQASSQAQTAGNRYGDSAHVSVGDSTMSVMSVHQAEQNIAIHDWKHLTQVLHSVGVSQQEADELSEAAKEDGGKLGPKVKDWIAKTAPKVIVGGMKMAATIGTSVLTEYLGKYFGVK